MSSILVGRVTNLQGEPLPLLTVRAYVRGLHFSDQQVGPAAVTDADGRYSIELRDDSARPGDKPPGPALFYIRAFDGEAAVGETEPQHLVEPKIVIDLRVDYVRADPNAPRLRVYGTIRNQHGAPVRGQSLRAFDLDLCGVAIYRDAQTLAELEANGGFEPLGQAVSDNRGAYQITFYEWQYRRAERKRADVVVYAIEAGLRIVGHSRLIGDEAYSNAGAVQDLDIVVTLADARVEYLRLTSALAPFLGESGVTLAQAATSYDQLRFCASELDLDVAHLAILGAATRLAANGSDASTELLYGIGRQGIAIDGPSLYRKSADELRRAIDQAATAGIIGRFDDSVVSAFLTALLAASVQSTLDQKVEGNVTLDALLAGALPERSQRTALLNALKTFDGTNPREFWSQYLPAQPEFAAKPQLITSLQLWQQLTALTGNHQPLVDVLRSDGMLASASQLLDLGTGGWLAAIAKSGVPAFVAGDTDEERAGRYAAQLEGTLNAAFPTLRIHKELEQGAFPMAESLRQGVMAFLGNNTAFDFATSRIDDFDQEIAAAAGGDQGQVKSQLQTLQRVFQVSPSPKAMRALFASGLGSAHAIVAVPRAIFLSTHGDSLGEDVAFAIYERASSIAARAELAAAKLMDYASSDAPDMVMGPAEHAHAEAVLATKLPDYASLFGSPDFCECGQCRSVYSAAAYLVDLLRFLSLSGASVSGKTPLEELRARRPDLEHLPLTCENTNTIIPYIDLANEVMEHYTAKGSLADYEGHDTGDTTSEELRASPQSFNLEAYRRLSSATYPFTLPYHQPLDAIRVYGDHLGISRNEAMKAVNPVPDAAAAAAIAAESVQLAQEERTIIAGASFDGTPDPKAAHEYFGYPAPGDLEKLSHVRELLARSGVAYPELVELVETRFLNPGRSTLDFLTRIFAHATVPASAIYPKLKQIAAGTLDPATDATITGALTAYNASAGTSVTPGAFGEWIAAHFAAFQQVVTLYEPSSGCALDTTRLRTIQSIYEGTADSGIPAARWSRFHRFVRLWRKLGWSIPDTDLVLAALGGTDLTGDTIAQLESLSLLRAATKLPLAELAALWGPIGTTGDKSLYRKLFLNRAAQQIDPAFQPNAWGDYLVGTGVLGGHVSAILAGFHIREDDLTAILGVARVIEGGVARPLDLATDRLDLANLSLLYRHVILAKALKLGIPDLCRLIDLFGVSPFSSPASTYACARLALAVKQAGFKVPVLEYIVRGTLSTGTRIGLDVEKVLGTAVDIRAALLAIERDHPTVPAAPLTAALLAGKLVLTFDPAMVASFAGLLSGGGDFEARADANLTVAIPAALAAKYVYVKGSGRLTSAGVMTDAERAVLEGLSGGNASFTGAIAALYAAPEQILAANFDGVFTDPAKANATLLDHPAQPAPVSLDDRLAYVYARFIPLLKRKLRRDVTTQHLASLLGLTEAATSLLVDADLTSLIADLSSTGFSATYYGDTTWTTAVLERIDATIDFTWGTAAPGPAVPAGAFSARWQARLAPPASGDYTLVVDVAQAGQAFRLYIDDVLVLEKAAADTRTSLEVVATLNGAKLHGVRLDYAGSAADAAVRLRWKTATSGLEVVPAAALYPAVVLDRFGALATLYHRAAQLVTGFALGEAELQHFLAHPADFGGVDFKALTLTHWQRMRDYTALRNSIPQAQARLTDVFAAAYASSPAPSTVALRARLRDATGWDDASLRFLVDTLFKLGVADFKNEIAIARIAEVMRIAARTGLAAATIARWGAADTDFDALYATSEIVKRAVKSRYQEADWLDLAGNLNDRLRESQKQALVAYLLTRPEIVDWGATDADGLFEYFLIDVQMGACMDTSRVVQANASIQMFVSRCLINLESGVSPGAIDKDRWEWMKNYRVWEANRKIFLYPENYLEPEWRKDRSELFKDLESYLIQNDITDRSVGTGFRTYLAGLNEVANLEICGLHRETDADDGTFKCLHVFGRTHNAPYKFHYRTWNKDQKWSTWEKVGVDVRCVDDGDNSGVHLLPVVWKDRLFLFWPEFIAKPKRAPGSKTFEGLSTATPSSLQAGEHWEIRLAWSEYVDGKWAPKQISKEFIDLDHYENIPGESALRFATGIDSANDLHIDVVLKLPTNYVAVAPSRSWYRAGQFKLSDITSKVVASRGDSGVVHKTWEEPPYQISFESVASYGQLKLGGHTYLKASCGHKVLVSSSVENYSPDFQDPFFFSDAYRTYFIRPVETTTWTLVRDPSASLPPISDLAASKAVAATSTLVMGGAAVGPAFAYASTADWAKHHHLLKTRDGLEFHTFYHPYSNKYVQALNQSGLAGLLESDTTLGSDGGETFETTYDPDFKLGLVARPADFAERTYYKENVCFDPNGANSAYNWELFFHAPLYIATRLSKNGKFSEAMRWFHYVFDPTTDAVPEPGKESSRYWKVAPFKTTAAESLEDWFRRLASDDSEKRVVAEWREHPFDPHKVAANRPIAYMKQVVIKYVENLIAWGDSLFRQDTMETVNEAIQLYVLASHILGRRPERVPRRGEIKAESYETLKGRWDDFSNALVALENTFPYSSEVSVSASSPGASFLGVGSALYFCIPPNDQLLGYWDTVADRLYKIRHCQNIAGVERHLALFSPPIDPAMLVGAMAQGLSLGSILADLSSPPPIYRFTYLIQKANELCADVKALGTALLAAFEKKDAEELARLRASHETQMLGLMTAIRERQVLSARASKQGLEKSRETAAFRLQHFVDLLGAESVVIPPSPALSATLTADTQLPGDTVIATVETGVDQGLADTDETGVKLIHKEKEELDKMKDARHWQIAAQAMEGLAAGAHTIPTLTTDEKPLGVGFGAMWGGTQLGNAFSAAGKVLDFIGSFSVHDATVAAKMGSYIRREQDWMFQANVAAREIVQLDKQITSADIQVQIAEAELANLQQSILNAQAVEQLLRDRFTNQELYLWMKEQLSGVYKQSYNLAYDMAKRAEKAHHLELGTDTASFIKYGYWDSSQQGLVAGEKLQLALRQLEKSYLDDNHRELELTRSVSVAQLDPLALISLRETGKCRVALPEELFDLDFRGHYFRRIKGVRLSLPCVVGPYTSVSCSLRLVNSTVRTDTSMNSEGNYEHENEDGVWLDDARFRESRVPVTAIATSTAQNDPGVFDFSFHDERYLPFERAGAISQWEVELSTEKELRQFDYSTIADVIMHVSYTAREAGGVFKEKATDHIKDFIANGADRATEPLVTAFRMRSEFPAEWARFLSPADLTSDQALTFVVGKERLPFFAQGRVIKVMGLDLLARCSKGGDYQSILSYIDRDGTPGTSGQFALPMNEKYGEMKMATLGVADLAIDALDIDRPLTLKLKHNSAPDYRSLATGTAEVSDLFLIIHYHCGLD